LADYTRQNTLDTREIKLEVPTVDWRPDHTIPEDYHAKSLAEGPESLSFPSDVVRLASSIVHDEDYDSLPIFGDALKDYGLDAQAELFDHGHGDYVAQHILNPARVPMPRYRLGQEVEGVLYPG